MWYKALISDNFITEGELYRLAQDQGENGKIIVTARGLLMVPNDFLAPHMADVIVVDFVNKKRVA